jgi:hypothetical protein
VSTAKDGLSDTAFVVLGPPLGHRLPATDSRCRRSFFDLSYEKPKY